MCRLIKAKAFNPEHIRSHDHRRKPIKRARLRSPLRDAPYSSIIKATEKTRALTVSPRIMAISSARSGPAQQSATGGAVKHGFGRRRRSTLRLLVLLKRVPIRTDRAVRRAMNPRNRTLFQLLAVTARACGELVYLRGSFGPPLPFVFTAICKAPPPSCVQAFFPPTCKSLLSTRSLLLTRAYTSSPQPFFFLFLTKDYGAPFFCLHLSDRS